MAKRSIFNTNNRKCLVVDKVDEAIFDYLLYHENVTTQTQMAEDLKALNLKQPTISNRLRKVGSNPFIYKNNIYIICHYKGTYQMIKLKNISVALTKEATEKQKKEFTEMFNKFIYELAEHKVLKGSVAKKISDSVILYEIRDKYYEMVKTTLFRLYGDDIYDIVKCEKGLYIILNQKYLKNKLSSSFENISFFYEVLYKHIEKGKSIRRGRARKDHKK